MIESEFKKALVRIPTELARVKNGWASQSEQKVPEKSGLDDYAVPKPTFQRFEGYSVFDMDAIYGHFALIDKLPEASGISLMVDGRFICITSLEWAKNTPSGRRALITCRLKLAQDTPPE